MFTTYSESCLGWQRKGGGGLCGWGTVYAMKVTHTVADSWTHLRQPGPRASGFRTRSRLLTTVGNALTQSSQPQTL